MLIFKLINVFNISNTQCKVVKVITSNKWFKLTEQFEHLSWGKFANSIWYSQTPIQPMCRHDSGFSQSFQLPMWKCNSYLPSKVLPKILNSSRQSAFVAQFYLPWDFTSAYPIFIYCMFPKAWSLHRNHVIINSNSCNHLSTVP